MPVIANPVRWQTKPAYPVEIDWGNSLASYMRPYLKGAFFFWDGAAPQNLISGVRSTTDTMTPTVVAEGPGKKAVYTSTQNFSLDGIDLGWVNPATGTNPYSLIVGYSQNSTSQYHCFIGQRTSDNRGVALYLGNTNKMGLVHYGVAGYETTAAVAAGVGKHAVYGYSHGGASTAVDFYHNGLFVETKSVGGINQLFDANDIRCGYDKTNIASEGVFNFVLVLSGIRLPALVQTEFGQAPYAILRPLIRRTYYFPSAGGTTNPVTVNVSAVGSITSSRQTAKIIQFPANVSAGIVKQAQLGITSNAGVTATVAKQVSKNLTVTALGYISSLSATLAAGATYLIRPRFVPWKQKPPMGAAPNWAEPFVSSCNVFLPLWNTGAAAPRNLARMQKIVTAFVGTAATGISKYGECLRCPASGDALDLGAQSETQLNNSSGIVVFSQDSLATTSDIFTTDSATVNGLKFRSTSLGELRIVCDGILELSTGTNVIKSGGLNVVAWTLDSVSGKMAIIVNGSVIAQTTSAVSLTHGAAGLWDDGTSDPASIYLFALSGISWPASYLCELTADPWGRLFAPKRALSIGRQGGATLFTVTVDAIATAAAMVVRSIGKIIGVSGVGGSSQNYQVGLNIPPRALGSATVARQIGKIISTIGLGAAVVSSPFIKIVTVAAAAIGAASVSTIKVRIIELTISVLASITSSRAISLTQAVRAIGSVTISIAHTSAEALVKFVGGLGLLYNESGRWIRRAAKWRARR